MGKRWPRHVFHIKAISQSKQMVGQFYMLPLPYFCLTMLEIPQLPLRPSISVGFVMRQLLPTPNRAVIRIIVRVRSASASIQLSL